MTVATTTTHAARVETSGTAPSLSVATRLGPALRFRLDDVPPWRGELLASLVLPAADLLALARPDRCRLLRHLRSLLVPGGELTVTTSGPERGEADAALDADGWLCGFEARRRESDAGIVLTRPARHRPDGPALVSIVIPAYKPTFFREALASALAQTHPRCEIVVCDDSPGDGIAAVVTELTGPDGTAGRHPVRYVRNPGTLGGRRNYLQCFDLARGEYVKFLNDDDRLAPGAVARMAAVLDALPGVTLVTSYRRLIDHTGRTLPDEIVNKVPVDVDAVVDGRLQAAALLAGRVNVVGEPTTVMFRKADAVDNRPHLMSYAGRSARRNGDLHIWTTLLSRGDIAWLTDPLSDFRRHGAQVQRSDRFRAEAELAWDELIADAEQTGLLDDRGPRLLDPWPLPVLPADVDGLVDEGERHHEAGRSGEASRCWRAALLLGPRDPRVRNDLACHHWLEGRRSRATGEALLAVAGIEAGTVAGPGLGDLLENLAAILNGTGRRREAAALVSRRW